VVRSRLALITVTVGEDCVMHQFGMRTVAVVVVAARAVLARRGRKGRSVEVCMLMMWWVLCQMRCCDGEIKGGSLAF
jgi:hypothetical protein